MLLRILRKYQILIPVSGQVKIPNVSPKTKYPFEPKSTSKLEPGHFWALPLSDGTFAAAVVLARGTTEDGKPHARMFIAGLLDWHGKCPPDENAIHCVQIVKSGVAHVRSIKETGSAVLGSIAPAWPLPVTTNVFNYMPVWGYEYALVMAERHFVLGQPMETGLHWRGIPRVLGY